MESHYFDQFFELQLRKHFVKRLAMFSSVGIFVTMISPVLTASHQQTLEILVDTEDAVDAVHFL
jgi:hypothetical protein